MFSYQEFKSKIAQEGVARNNRFNVIIPIPSSLASPYESYSLSLFCNSVSIAGVNIASEPVKLFGENIEVPYDRNFSGATFTFLVASDLLERKIFDDWFNLIQNPTSRVFSYMDEFKAKEVIVEVLDLDDNPKYQIVLYDAFPKNIGALTLSSENNSVMSFDVTMDYRYYTTGLVG